MTLITSSITWSIQPQLGLSQPVITQNYQPRYRVEIIQPSPNDLTHQAASIHLLNAQRLRTRSFNDSFGATFSGFHPSSDQPLDIDEYDQHCVHIVIYDDEHQDDYHQPLAIATTRLLDKQGAINAGHFYSEHEFKLTKFLDAYPYNVLEIGRTCIHPHYRDSVTINKLWSAIGRVARQFNVNGFMGCASIALSAGDVNRWLADLDTARRLDIKPVRQLPIYKNDAEYKTAADISETALHLPALMGCSISNEACYDPSFHCADVFIWLPFEQIKPRYQRYIH